MQSITIVIWSTQISSCRGQATTIALTTLTPRPLLRACNGKCVCCCHAMTRTWHVRGASIVITRGSMCVPRNVPGPVHAPIHPYILTHMDVCDHACTHACMHAYMYACSHACMQSHPYACDANQHIHACMHVYMRTDARIHAGHQDACLLEDMYADMHATIHACMQPHMHTIT